MNAWHLIVRGLRYYARSHAGVLAGSSVAAAILCGALIMGDSVRESLRALALARLGATHYALASQDRYFRQDLANDLRDGLGASNAPALLFNGVATRADGSARANHVNVLGVDTRFWDLASAPPPAADIQTNGVLLNDRLAAQLNVHAGDAVLLRVSKPSLLPRDAPISPQEDVSTALRLTVRGILNPSQLGNFSLQASQVAPYNAFVPLERLQMRLGLTNRANLLLTREPTRFSNDVATVNAELSKRWTLADAQLEVRAIPTNGQVELRSPRVFLDEAVVRAGMTDADKTGAKGVLTYFVNDLQCGTNRTPYSMVCAYDAAFLPSDFKVDEIVLNAWLAKDLGARVGDKVGMTFFVVGASRTLVENKAQFRVRAITPLEGPAADRTLMPDFPGLAQAENCRDWDAGFPIDLNRIRPKDQKYWEDHRGTPKAFISLAAGQTLWTNRFGSLTAVRYSAPPASVASVEASLRERLDPAAVGLAFQPARAQALQASTQGQDFGQLFLGFSFFLIFAALLLMAMLFQFGMEQRGAEMGILLALGFTPRKVYVLLLCEGICVALAGGLIGVLCGSLYARALLHGLATLWQDAVNSQSLTYHASLATLTIGFAASVLTAIVVMMLALRKQIRRPAHELMAAGGTLEITLSHRPRIMASLPLLAITGAGGLGAMFHGLNQHSPAPGAFFAAGALLLLAGFSACARWLWRGAQHRNTADLSLTGLALRSLARRPKRSLGAVMLLACGSFLIIAVAANRLDARQQANLPRSGTGGFAFLAESALPIFQNLDRPEGRAFLALDAAALEGVHTVPMRVRDGDEASCLNLNRAQAPRLLGVRADALTNRFVFAEIAKGMSAPDPWLLLREPLADGAVPAIADQASILWAMGKNVGDTLEIPGPRGQTVRLRFVAALSGSILQGSVLISEEAFIRNFPDESGYRAFLIDAPGNSKSAAPELTRGLRDYGMELVPTVSRLEALNAVQNTYLSTFQVLGGLGLLLGSVGMGVVLLRNVFERRGELALLVAVGYSPGTIRRMLLTEHVVLLTAGLLLGVVAALAAVLPALLAPGSEMPWHSLAWTLAAVFANGLLWTGVATHFALRQNVLEALRANDESM
jgi:ABC-type antimicrobial peptide transport system permease subunit